MHDGSKDARDAARYRWLRNHFLGVDFDWGVMDEDGTHGIQVLLFTWPGREVSADLDATLDEAMESA